MKPLTLFKSMKRGGPKFVDEAYISVGFTRHYENNKKVVIHLQDHHLVLDTDTARKLAAALMKGADYTDNVE